MPMVGRTRSWKGHVTLACVILVTASLGTLAGDCYLQAQRAHRGRMEASRAAGTRIDPSMSMPGMMPLSTGVLAPALDLPAVGEGGAFHLASYRGVRPVVLVFGSLSCDLFQSQIPELGRIYHQHKGHVMFAFIAVWEAGHRLPGYEFLLEDAEGKTPEEASEQRRQCVGKAMALSGLPLPAYLDLPDHSASRAYMAWPRRLVVVDREGRIAQDFGSSIASPWDLERLGQVLDAQGPA
jgi:hypothetical protein